MVKYDKKNPLSTILSLWITEDVKEKLISVAAESTLRQGKQVSISDVVRDAIVDYLSKLGVTMGA